MIIGFDINEANVAQRVGVNQVAYELFSHLVGLNSQHQIIALSKDRPLPDLSPSSNKLHYETFGPTKAWVLTGLTKRLFFGKPKIDVLFSPSHYSPLLSKTPAVIAIMDLSYEHFGAEYFTNYDLNQLKRWTPMSARKAKYIITISEFTKKEIINRYKTVPDKIIVIHPGINTAQFHAKIPQTKQLQVKNKFGITGKYFLYVGTLQPRKNLSRLIQAFKKLITQEQQGTRNLKLVIGGKKGWLYDQIFQEARDLQIADKVIFTGFVPAADLPGLIKASIAYVLPSLYEGFGMPPVEAQSVGTPVVVSRNSSLPEIVGESGIYIDDATSVANLKDALKRALKLSKPEREQIISQGKINAKRFDWDAAANKLIAVLTSAKI